MWGLDEERRGHGGHPEVRLVLHHHHTQPWSRYVDSSKNGATRWWRVEWICYFIF